MYDLKIGFKCNNNCKHCVIAAKKETRDLTYDEICRYIDKIPKNIKDIQITGGEPSFYAEKLIAILQYCKEKDFKTHIQTNATGFSDLNFCKKCSPYMDHCHVAIHSYDAKIHDTIVGTNGMWEKTVKGFNNLLSENIKCTTQTVLSKYNISSLEKTYDFIQEKKPGTLMAMTYPHICGNALKYKDEVVFQYSQYKEVFQNCLKKYASLLTTESIPFCYLHPYANDVEWMVERDLISLPEARIGVDISVNRRGLIDYNLSDILDHKKGPLCKNCIYNKKCIGVWKEYIQIFKNNLDLYPIIED